MNPWMVPLDSDGPFPKAIPRMARQDPRPELPALDGLPLTTARLCIRAFRLEDQPAYHAIFGDPVIARYDDFEPISDAEALVNLHEIQAGYAADHSEQEFAVERNGEVVGTLVFVCRDGGCYVGYHFRQSVHGQGLATEAMRAFLGWLRRRHLPLRAVCDPGNAASIRVLEKLGFVQGARREANGKLELEYHLPS